MGTAQEIFDELSAPFPIEYIEWRVGSTNKDKSKCLPLCYIDARAVMDRLDAVCGPDGWQCNYTPGAGGMVICNLGIRVDGAWLWKSDGAGQTDIEGDKGALSDALKRAAVRWGIGRYLYDLKAPWVDLKDGRYIDEAVRKTLNELHEDFAQKSGWGLRSGVQAYRLCKKVVGEFVTDPAAAQEFKDRNAAEIAQLPVAMRKHLYAQLDRIGSAA